MKKLILLFITTSFVLSQNLIWSVDGKYENGNIRAISYHQKIWQKIEFVKKETYYQNGQIKSEKNYKDSKRDGKFIYYYENGQIKEEGNYKDGERDGKWTRYYKNEQVDSEGNWKGYENVGKWTFYYENGQIKRVGNYKDGERDGKWTYYNEDGSIDKIDLIKIDKIEEGEEDDDW